MAVEILKDTLAIGLPQNSRRSGMENDLMEIPKYRETIEEADEILSLEPKGSLSELLQSASVTHSVAIFRAIEAETCKFAGVLTAPSIGENTMLERTKASSLARILNCLTIRQKVTEQPVGEGIRTMIAVAGADPDELEHYLEAVKTNLGDRVQAVISNINAPKELVISISLPAEITVPQYLKELKGSVGEQVANLKTAWLKKITNAFHSPTMTVEQLIYQQEVKQLYGEHFIQQPDPKVHWFSPMLIDWIKTQEQAENLFLHPLTPPVNLKTAMTRIFSEHDIKRIIIPDPLNIIPGILERNLITHEGAHPKIVNITDRASFDQAATLLTASY